jgi:transposase
MLLETSDMVKWRSRYIRAIRQFRREGWNIFFLDETYVHQNSSVGKAWRDNSLKTAKEGLKCKTGKGKRIIVINIGNEKGFLPGAGQCWVSDGKTDDYHDDMNFENFSKWLKNDVLPRLPPKSLLVMDNAKYHCKKAEGEPGSKSRKCELKEWLDKNNFVYDKKALKPALWQLVKGHLKTDTKLAIDELIHQHGHQVLRLPPYHCELNPIEMVWAWVKNKIKICNNTFKTKDVLALTRQVMENVPPELWANCVRHVIQEEDMYAKLDGILDEMPPININPIIIRIDPNETESDFDYDDDDDFDNLEEALEAVNWTSIDDWLEVEEDTRCSSHDRDDVVCSSQDRQDTLCSSQDQDDVVCSSQDRQDTLCSSQDQQDTLCSSQDRENVVCISNGRQDAQCSSHDREDVLRSSHGRQDTLCSSHDRQDIVHISHGRQDALYSSHDREDTTCSSHDQEDTICSSHDQEDTTFSYFAETFVMEDVAEVEVDGEVEVEVAEVHSFTHDKKSYRQTSDGQFQCLLCLVSKKRHCDIIKHLNTHKNCSKCGKQFEGKNASTCLKRHELICYRPKAPKQSHQCKFCEKILKFKSYKKRHEKECLKRIL